MLPKISIIMPVYNSQAFLSQAIQSVLNQTYRNFELIIINDGSSDRSGDIIKSFYDSRIKYISLSRSHGPAIARNKGLNIASGEYITFLDSDDKWLPDNLYLQLSFIEKYDLDLIYDYYDFIYSNGHIKKKITLLPKELTYYRLLMSNPIKISSCFFKSSIIGNTRFPNIGNEDYAFWLLLFRHSKVKAKLFPYICTEIRLHPHSVSSNKFKSCKWVWNIYRNQEKLSFIQALFFFCMFIIYGVIKHQDLV